MQFKGMIFDLDGTLAETWPICFEAFRKTFIKHTGIEYSDTEIAQMFGPDEEGIIKRFVKDDWQTGVQTYLDEYEAVHYLCESPFPGIADALLELKQKGIRLAIVTGKGIGSALISIGRLKLDGLFDEIKAGHVSGGRKWDSIAEVLDQWKLNPCEIAYIGDAPTDVDAARKAGVTPIGAAWSKHSDYDAIKSRNPAEVFQTVEEFRSWVDQIA